MHVTITTRQLNGTLPSKKSYFVDCMVLFSEEEKAIIHARGLGQHYFVVGPETRPPSNTFRTFSILLQILSPVFCLGGCVTGLGMVIAGNSRGESVSGLSFFGAMAMYLAGFAMRRHVKVADQPQQVITLNRLLTNSRFSIYAFDNAIAKAIDDELRMTLAKVKDGLAVNARIAEPETFEL